MKYLEHFGLGNLLGQKIFHTLQILLILHQKPQVIILLGHMDILLGYLTQLLIVQITTGLINSLKS